MSGREWAGAAVILAAVAGGVAVVSGEPPATRQTEDALWDSRGCADERSEWFRDAKFGAIIHFGPYSHLGGYYQGKGPYRPAEQIMGLGERRAVIPPATYRDEVAVEFNPVKFDAEEWVSRVKAAGQRYVIFTTKHHDGFCMFRTATTPFNVVEQTPFARDVVKELSEACARQGVVFCPYYSIGDWSAAVVQNPGYGSYRKYMQAQLRELLTNYGEIKLLWFDNWWYVDGQWKNDEAHAKELYAFARGLSPGTLVNDRCGTGAKGTDGDYATPENELVGSLQSRYFEVVMTNTADDHWGWVRDATNYRPAEEIIRALISSTAHGGNFVLNVGPTAEGEFPAEHAANLEKVGAWLKVNGEAIYATRPAPEIAFEDGPAVAHATRSKDGRAVYLHVIDWPGESLALTWSGRGTVKQARLLDAGLGALQWSAAPDASGAVVRIARPAHTDPLATVIRLDVGPE